MPGFVFLGLRKTMGNIVPFGTWISSAPTTLREADLEETEPPRVSAIATGHGYPLSVFLKRLCYSQLPKTITDIVLHAVPAGVAAPRPPPGEPPPNPVIAARADIPPPTSDCPRFFAVWDAEFAAANIC